MKKLLLVVVGIVIGVIFHNNILEYYKDFNNILKTVTADLKKEINPHENEVKILEQRSKVIKNHVEYVIKKENFNFHHKNSSFLKFKKLKYPHKTPIINTNNSVESNKNTIGSSRSLLPDNNLIIQKEFHIFQKSYLPNNQLSDSYSCNPNAMSDSCNLSFINIAGILISLNQNLNKSTLFKLNTGDGKQTPYVYLQ